MSESWDLQFQETSCTGIFIERIACSVTLLSAVLSFVMQC